MDLDIRCCGYLLKKAPAMMGWRRRFFVLHAGGLLCCYENETSTRGRPQLEVTLTETTRVEPARTHEYGLRIHLPNTSLLLSAGNAEDFARWMAQLQQATVPMAASRDMPGSNNSLDGFETPRTRRVERSESESKPLARRLSRHSVLGKEFVVDARYEQLKGIGQGAYGIVVSCLDTVTQKRLAIKKISQLFEDAEDAKRIIREIRFMRSLNHPNILALVDVFDPLIPEFNDLYIASDLMDTDLHKVIKSGQTLTEEHQRFIMYQLMLGLDHLHASGIIHRDLKPSNILLSLRCDVKICDFGLARIQNEVAGDAEGREKMTEYVVTRWYRAPEIMLSSGHYTSSVDVWGAGCIFAEMQLSDPLFKGKNYIQQLKLIAKFLGNPTADDLQFIRKPRALDFMQRLPPYNAVPFSVMFPRLSGEGRELMKQMLKFKPDNRITARQSLAITYFDSVRNPEQEAISPSLVEADDIEGCPLEVPRLRALMTQEINRLKQRPDGPPDDSASTSSGSANAPSPEAIPTTTTSSHERRSSWRNWLPRYSTGNSQSTMVATASSGALLTESQKQLLRRSTVSDDDECEEVTAVRDDECDLVTAVRNDECKEVTAVLDDEAHTLPQNASSPSHQAQRQE